MSNTTSFSKICSIYELMENKDKEALYQFQFYLQSSPYVNDIFNKKFRELCLEILNNNTLLISGPALFVNRPNTERLLYKWHSESHYYPKRRNFINIWFPLFTNKTKNNGTMSFKLNSHKKQYPFSEYFGYNKDSENKKNHFLQYEVPTNFVEDLEEHFIIAERGDLIIFHKDLIHKSNENPSKDYSIAMVARVWEPSKDLTLSGKMDSTPYGGDIGRSNIIVDI